MNLKGTLAIMATGIVAGLAFATCAGNTGGNPATPPPTMPAPPQQVIVNWCTPVAVPLYTNGTDCQ